MTPTERAEKLAEMQLRYELAAPQIADDFKWILSELAASEARAKECAVIMRWCADYLDALEVNMLRNDADMQMDPSEAPSDVAASLRAAADQAEGVKL